MTRRGRWSHGGGSAGRPRCENPRELAVQLSIRENAIVTQFYGLRHCCSLCFLASQRQLHLRSLCHSCCLSPPARRLRRPPTPTATRAGSPCVGLYAGVTGRGSGRPPVCSTQLLEHPGSAGVLEPLNEGLAWRFGVPEGKGRRSGADATPATQQARTWAANGRTHHDAASLSVLVPLADTTASRSSKGLFHHTPPTTGKGSAPPAPAVLPRHVLSARLQSSPGTSSAP